MLESNDPSQITNGLSDNIQKIAESFNGLVGVARLSHETQQMNMLHARRKQLEDCIAKLDESCMDMELKCIDSSGSRKKLFQKVLKKKETEMEEKKKELNDTMLEITKKLLQQHLTSCNKCLNMLTWLILLMKKILVQMMTVFVDGKNNS